MSSKTLVIGPTFLDIQVFLQDLESGTLDSSRSIGGKGFNVARNLRAFDVNVDLATMYDEHQIGNYLERQIEEAGIGHFPSNRVDRGTGIFVGVHDQTGETLFDKADTSMFEAQKLRCDLADYSEVLVLSSTNQDILDQLKSEREKTSSKTTLCLELSGRKTVDHIKPYLSIFDFVIANRIETEALLDTTDIENGVKTFTRTYKSIFIATLDQNGIIASQNGESFLLPIHFLPTPVVSTVGAGDSVTAAILAYYYRQGLTLREAIHNSMIVAAHMVRQSSPFLTEVPGELTV